MDVATLVSRGEEEEARGSRGGARRRQRVGDGRLVVVELAVVAWETAEMGGGPKPYQRVAISAVRG